MAAKPLSAEEPIEEIEDEDFQYDAPLSVKVASARKEEYRQAARKMRLKYPDWVRRTLDDKSKEILGL